MGKDKEIRIKANGIRNELKEIRKVLVELTHILRDQQTHKQHEEDTSFGTTRYIGNGIWPDKGLQSD